MPSYTSSAIYPSESGSDVDRSSDFWELPTFAPSSPALSTQSMVTNLTSEMDPDGLEVLVSFPSETTGYKFHERFTEWLVTTLYPKLLAVEEVWRRFEAMNDRLVEANISRATMGTCIRTGLLTINAVMAQQHLRLTTTDTASGKVHWTMFLDEDAVFHGEAHSTMEVMCGDFYVKRLAQLMMGAPRCVAGRL